MPAMLCSQKRGERAQNSTSAASRNDSLTEYH